MKVPKVIQQFAASRGAARSLKKWPRSLLLGGLIVSLWAGVLAPHRPAASFARASAAMDHNDVEPLQYELLLLRESDKYESHAGLVTGALLLADNHPDEALVQLGLAADHPDTATRSQALAGRALYLTGRFLEAGEIWQQVLKTDPKNVNALRWLGIAYYDLGALHQASHYFEQAAQQLPGDGSLYADVGSIMSESGRYSAAIEAFQESLRRDPHQRDVDDVRLRLADCHLELREIDKALAVLADCGTSADVLVARARCFHDQGQSDSALRLLEEAHDLNPRHPTILGLQAQILLEKGNGAQALDLLERASAAAPMHLEVQYQLMVAYQREGMNQKAAAQKALFDKLNKLVDQYKQLEEDARADPRNPEIRIELGKLARRLGRLDSAGNWLRAAIYLDPDNAAAREALLDLLRNPRAIPDSAG